MHYTPGPLSPAARSFSPDVRVTAALLPLALLAADPAPAGPAPAREAAAAKPAPAVRFEPFELRDQFGAAHRVAGEKGAVLVVIYGDRGAAEACGELGAALHVLFHPAAAGRDAADAADAPVRPVPGMPCEDPPPVRVAAAACTRGVPGPVRAAVAFRLRRAAPHTPVLLDWGGELTDRFGAAPGVPNAVVVAPGGGAHRIDVADAGRRDGAAGRVERAVERLRRGLVAARPAG